MPRVLPKTSFKDHNFRLSSSHEFSILKGISPKLVICDEDKENSAYCDNRSDDVPNVDGLLRSVSAVEWHLQTKEH